ncbi:MAG: efflux RND transporter periplasmic adaptor subunit [Hyphomicrobiaceae bacterium]|nr:efflux RND transporter periplasmic adaptor subunit [Hyphomicrobiaceae bacterium]
MRRTLTVGALGASMMGLLAAGGCGEERKAAEKAAPAPAASGDVFTVAQRQVEDLKPVLATVRSKRVVEARVRTPGTVASLKIVEGDHVEPGQVLGLVVDPKIALRLKASDAQIVALESRLATARAEFDRTSELLKRGVAPQARLDQAKTAFDVATNELSAARSERAVIEKQAEEGEVLAPATGRVLRIPVTEGSVVLAGESIATVAANEYLLRVEVPERHARFMAKGNGLKVGARGLSADTAAIEGRIVQIYPEIQGGRVVADAEVQGLGNYFVGERTLAWISAGTRSAVELPRDLVFKRYGLDYVRLAGPDGKASDVVVQLGQPEMDGKPAATVEVLTGIKPGDRLVRP